MAIWDTMQERSMHPSFQIDPVTQFPSQDQKNGFLSRCSDCF